MNRPNWNEYFMSFARIAALRSTCLRRQVGAVVVKDRRVVATGYNGAPERVMNCDLRGCIRQEQSIPSGQCHEKCHGVHAEENALLQAARFGQSIEGGIIYTTNSPCTMCAKSIINAGIVTVIYQDGYPDEIGRKLLIEAGITLAQYKPNQ